MGVSLVSNIEERSSGRAPLACIWDGTEQSQVKASSHICATARDEKSCVWIVAMTYNGSIGLDLHSCHPGPLGNIGFGLSLCPCVQLREEQCSSWSSALYVSSWEPSGEEQAGALIRAKEVEPLCVRSYVRRSRTERWEESCRSFLRACLRRVERLDQWFCVRLQGIENLEPLLLYLRPLSCSSVQMLPDDLMLEDGVKDIGNKLVSLPSNLQWLLLLLDKAENLLSRMKQSPSTSMLITVQPAMKALIAKDLLGHLEMDVKVSITFFFSKMTKIITQDAPYDDDIIKEIFGLIVRAFKNLDEMSIRSFSKRVSILEIVAKVRSYVLMLDLDCDDLILEIFLYFVKTIRSKHSGTVYSSMETIMILVLEETESIYEGEIFHPEKSVAAADGSSKMVTNNRSFQNGNGVSMAAKQKAEFHHHSGKSRVNTEYSLDSSTTKPNRTSDLSSHNGIRNALLQLSISNDHYGVGNKKKARSNSYKKLASNGGRNGSKKKVRVRFPKNKLSAGTKK
ncbi:hypothetical protein IEQ34_006256 [Dendrobium chrysotoxum]|uniref:Uncharacterized protein n=1 Tax=Dendrobium chrysotoxum TaxID=161865 RepID=A0AAV7HDN4_DENCH|nr:hypothetical protein IEQ34_006256 [Dendrobium chrysotoxum]